MTAQAGYGFDLAENTDGSTNRISLGTVSATDPDGGSVTYTPKIVALAVEVAEIAGADRAMEAAIKDDHGKILGALSESFHASPPTVGTSSSGTG